MTIEELIKKLRAIDMAIESLTYQNLSKPNNTCEVDLSIYEEAGRDGYEQGLKDRAEMELMRTETQERNDK